VTVTSTITSYSSTVTSTTTVAVCTSSTIDDGNGNQHRKRASGMSPTLAPSTHHTVDHPPSGPKLAVRSVTTLVLPQPTTTVTTTVYTAATEYSTATIGGGTPTLILSSATTLAGGPSATAEVNGLSFALELPFTVTVYGQTSANLLIGSVGVSWNCVDSTTSTLVDHYVHSIYPLPSSFLQVALPRRAAVLMHPLRTTIHLFLSSTRGSTTGMKNTTTITTLIARKEIIQYSPQYSHCGRTSL